MKILWRRRAVLFGGVVFFLVPPFLLGGALGFASGALCSRGSSGAPAAAVAPASEPFGRESPGYTTTTWYDQHGNVIESRFTTTFVYDPFNQQVEASKR